MAGTLGNARAHPGSAPASAARPLLPDRLRRVWCHCSYGSLAPWAHGLLTVTSSAFLPGDDRLAAGVLLVTVLAGVLGLVLVGDLVLVFVPVLHVIGGLGGLIGGVGSAGGGSRAAWRAGKRPLRQRRVRGRMMLRRLGNDWLQFTSDKLFDLVFFSSFEDLRLHITGTIKSNGIRKLYEPSPVPTPDLQQGW